LILIFGALRKYLPGHDLVDFIIGLVLISVIFQLLINFSHLGLVPWFLLFKALVFDLLLGLILWFIFNSEWTTTIST
jgi:hypothetical protein